MNKAAHARRKTVATLADVSAIESDLVSALRTVRDGLDPTEESREDHAIAAIETFVAIALHVMQRCPPTLIRHAAQVIEIRAHLDGVPVRTTEAV